MRVLWVLGVSSGMLCVAATNADAVPTEWSSSAGGNGHWYEVVSAGTGASWETASAAATARGGYLATIASAGENAFVFGLSDNPAFWVVDSFNIGLGPWLGAFQPEGSPEPAGGWSWVTGEVFSYANWAPFQPNEFTFPGYPTENRINFLAPAGTSPPRSPQWGDIWNEVQLPSYVVEWNSQPVPEPSTWLQLALGVSLLGFLARGHVARVRSS